MSGAGATASIREVCRSGNGARRGSSRRWTDHHSRSAQGSVESDPCRKKNLLGCYLGLSTRRVVPGRSPSTPACFRPSLAVPIPEIETLVKENHHYAIVH